VRNAQGIDVLGLLCGSPSMRVRALIVKESQALCVRALPPL
jgi:hypothetical protein